MRQLERGLISSGFAAMCVCGCLLTGWTPPAISQDTSSAKQPLARESAKDDVERKERLEFMKRQAAEYDVTLNIAKPTKLILHDEPLMRFSNPVGGVPDGILVMWKDGTRPAVFAQIFQTKDGLWLHECQSLAVAGLTMQRGEKVVWKPVEGGEEFRRLKGATIAESPTKRLIQMKLMALAFSATDDFKIKSSDTETTRHTLRMLPTPVYRYQDSTQGVTDAAVFAFVHGTDPEVFLVLEHRTSPQESGTGWFYALAPMTCWGVNVMQQGTEVWSVPERLGKNKSTDPYYVWGYRPDASNP